MYGILTFSFEAMDNYYYGFVKHQIHGIQAVKGALQVFQIKLL